MKQEQIREYSVLVEFLGNTLGPAYEVALHDLETGAIVALANGHVSGRSIGSPLTNMALRMIANKQYENSDYRLNYSGISVKGKVIRSSTMFIKSKDGTPVGLLCVNFDDTQFHDLSLRVLQLVHPDGFVREHFSEKDALEPYQAADEPESFPTSLEEVMQDVMAEITAHLEVPMNRLTQEEKMQIVAQLHEKGLFRLKGAVQHVAEWLCCSQASMYRYLSKLSKG